MSEKSALRYRLELYKEELRENINDGTIKGSILLDVTRELNKILEETK